MKLVNTHSAGVEKLSGKSTDLQLKADALTAKAQTDAYDTPGLGEQGISLL